MREYEFKVGPELWWAAIVAGAAVVGQALIALDPATVTDWQTWALGVLAGAARAAGAVVIGRLFASRP